MAITSFPSFLFYLCLFLFVHGSMAQLFGQSNPWLSFRQGGIRGCRFDRLQAFEPLRQERSEAGFTEYYEEQNEQFRCAGLSVIRRVIEPQGLLLPRYHNTPGLVYILQGSGFTGLTFPGCPETFQQQFGQFDQLEFAQDQSQGHKFRDEHQKVHQIRQGDVVALPVGVAHWFYNHGQVSVVALYVFDVNNNANQLEPRQKEFLLAGGSRALQQYVSQNIFRGFNFQLLGEALGISEHTSQRLSNQNDQRGDIIRVNRALQFLQPIVTQQQEQEPYSQVGQYQNAILSPFWNINAHSVMYTIQGHVLVQVVNNHGQNVFDGILRPGQLLIIPQNYVVIKKAKHEGCQYISFKTNANSMVSNIAGKTSILRALPVDVIANAYRITRQEAQNLKHNRGEEFGAFAPKFSQIRFQSYPQDGTGLSSIDKA